MAIEQKLPLPFGNNFQVDLGIRIVLERESYTAYILPPGGSEHPVPISVKKEDVPNINRELQTALEEVTDSFSPSGSSTMKQEAAVKQLISKGSRAFKGIFVHPATRAIIEQALRHARIVQITSQDFIIPWELLYHAPSPGMAKIQGFWGMRFNLARAFPNPPRQADLELPVIHSQRPRVGLIICRELEQVVNHELPALKTMSDNKVINLSLLRSLVADRRDSELEHFERFLAQEREIVHVACHAFENPPEKTSSQPTFPNYEPLNPEVKKLLDTKADKGPSGKSHLWVEKEFAITMEDFSDIIPFARPPLVILNACRSGTMNPASTSNWAFKFWEREARGILATELEMPDWFAASFIKQVYKHLLPANPKQKPKPIGLSLLEARYHFWNRGGNPLGLGYALYAAPNIQFAR